MARPGSELAARFRRVVDAAERRRAREEAERRKRLERARAARKALLADLRAFGEAVGHLQVHDGADGGVVLRYRERSLQFAPIGEADRVKVTFTGSDDEEHRLYREPELGDRWVWRAKRRGREERMPLFDAGLEELCVRALELPRPSERDDVELVPLSTLEDAIPAGRRVKDGGSR